MRLTQPAYAGFDQICREESGITPDAAVRVLSEKETRQMMNCLDKKNYDAALNAATVEAWRQADRSEAFGEDFIMTSARQSFKVLEHCRATHSNSPDTIKDCYSDLAGVHNDKLAIFAALGGPTVLAAGMLYLLARRPGSGRKARRAGATQRANR